MSDVAKVSTSCAEWLIMGYNKAQNGGTMCYWYNSEAVPNFDIDEVHVFTPGRKPPVVTGKLNDVIKGLSPQQFYDKYSGDLGALGLDKNHTGLDDFKNLLKSTFGKVPDKLSAFEFTVAPYDPDKVFNYINKTPLNQTFVYDCY